MLAKQIAVIFVLCVVICLIPTAAYAQDSNGVSLQPNSVHVSTLTDPQTQLVLISVTANLTTPARTFGFYLQFDPEYLAVVPLKDKTEKESLVQIGNLFNQANGFLARARQESVGADGKTAQLDISYTLIAPNAVAKGQGRLATVAFKTLKPGVSYVTLVEPRVVELDSKADTARFIPLTLGEPFVKVTAGEVIKTETGKPPEPQFLLTGPLIGALIIVLILFILFVLMMRRRLHIIRTSR